MDKDLLFIDSTLNRKVHYQVGVGIATTNFNYPEVGYLNKPIFILHSDVTAVKNINSYLDFRFSIGYEPVGYTTTVNLLNNRSIYDKTRLYYVNSHVLAGYSINKKAKKLHTVLLVGFYVGRLIDQDIVGVFKPENIKFRTKAQSTYRFWNAGVSAGLASSVKVNNRNDLGLKLLASPGLTNIYIPEATRRSGLKRFTRSICLSTFFSF
ncbi:hypothetical protein LC612_40920 [Nostoc sp. CHAB 5834]|nr:hypothetical protein [Nostoc sp. CHAB 5834]